MIFNLLAIAFGIGLVQRVRTDNQSRGEVVGTLGALSLLVEGVFGFVTVFFPQDPGGAPTTFTGTMHIVLAGLSSLTSMLTILLMGFWLRSIPSRRGYSAYSFISVIVVFLSGGLAAVTVANDSPIGGLLERITIGGFLQWLFVVALILYRAELTQISSAI